MPVVSCLLDPDGLALVIKKGEKMKRFLRNLLVSFSFVF